MLSTQGGPLGDFEDTGFKKKYRDSVEQEIG
jgi:hypothetical protein